MVAPAGVLTTAWAGTRPLKGSRGLGAPPWVSNFILGLAFRADSELTRTNLPFLWCRWSFLKPLLTVISLPAEPLHPFEIRVMLPFCIPNKLTGTWILVTSAGRKKSFHINRLSLHAQEHGKKYHRP